MVPINFLRNSDWLSWKSSTIKHKHFWRWPLPPVGTFPTFWYIFFFDGSPYQVEIFLLYSGPEFLLGTSPEYFVCIVCWQTWSPLYLISVSISSDSWLVTSRPQHWTSAPHTFLQIQHSVKSFQAKHQLRAETPPPNFVRPWPPLKGLLHCITFGDETFEHLLILSGHYTAAKPWPP